MRTAQAACQLDAEVDHLLVVASRVAGCSLSGHSFRVQGSQGASLTPSDDARMGPPAEVD